MAEPMVVWRRMVAGEMVALRSWLLGVALLVLPSTVLAQPADVDQLADQLAHAKDFRVRTQAALALGASKSKRAVDPLCGGLRDENATVRTAAAAGLGKLRKGGVACLKKQLAVEAKVSVKSVIERSISRIEAEVAPRITDQTKYYVALEAIDDSGRGGDAVARLFHDAAKATASALPEFAVAPREQSIESAAQLLKSHPSVKGFLLSSKVKVSYAGATLTVKIDTAIFTYPDRNLLGTFSKTLSMQGVSGPSLAAEDQLIQAGATRSIETFGPMAPKLR
ncbi:MAG: HEAT repeat domain-containing protein [Polyangiaceae bacterium]|nr:HEAT repeat domain-containing protein [Polyangiaceae bacterium]